MPKSHVRGRPRRIGLRSRARAYYPGPTLTSRDEEGTVAAPAPEAPLDRRRFAVFGLTWLSYATYYLTRKNYSVSKASLQRTFGMSTEGLGWIDAGYSAAYAIGQFVWGAAADRFGPRRVLGAGMLATALCSMAFGLSTTFAGFLLFYSLNGLAQGTGWSSNVKAMAGWFPAARRGVVMGLWTTNYTVGGLVANPVAREFLDGLGWQWAFFGPAVPVATVGLVLLFGLPERADARAQRGPSHVSVTDRVERVAARRALLKNPMLWALGATYFFLKLVRYFLWNWLPYYMETVLHYDGRTSAYAPLAFDAAGVLGAISLGWLSDRFFRGRRVPVAVVSILLLAASLAVYAHVSKWGLVPNVVVLGLMGFLLFGPDAMVSATAAQDLGGPRTAALAAGIINGLGSLGQIVSGPLAKYAPKDDWAVLFSVLAAVTALSAVFLAPFWRRTAEPSSQGQ